MPPHVPDALFLAPRFRGQQRTHGNAPTAAVVSLPIDWARGFRVLARQAARVAEQLTTGDLTLSATLSPVSVTLYEVRAGELVPGPREDDYPAYHAALGELWPQAQLDHRLVRLNLPDEQLPPPDALPKSGETLEEIGVRWRDGEVVCRLAPWSSCRYGTLAYRDVLVALLERAEPGELAHVWRSLARVDPWEALRWATGERGREVVGALGVSDPGILLEGAVTPMLREATRTLRARRRRRRGRGER